MALLIHELLASSVQRFPNRPAIIGPKKSLSYQELDDQSNALARTLMANGVQPGDLIGLAMHKCIDAIVAVYGILKAGAAYVPIDVFAPTNRSLAIVKNTKLKTLVTNSDRLATLAVELQAHPDGASLQTFVVPQYPQKPYPDTLNVAVWEDGEMDTRALPDITSAHLAYILHTSGSTGIPKGVAISHRNALYFVNMATDFWGVGEDDRLCSQAPLHFDLSVFDLYVAAQAGAAVVLIPEFYAAFPKKMASAIDTHQITIWNSVVSTLTLMMQKGKPDEHSFASLRHVIFSGEVMPLRYLRELLLHMSKARMFNVYGQTEANSSMFFEIDRANIPDDSTWKIPLGKAFPGFYTYILDEQNREITTPDKTGELYVRAGSVATGYWQSPQKSADKFVIDPLCPQTDSLSYRTGDLASLDAKGLFCFAGRRDDMIKIRGYRVELGEIDLALLSCEGVESAASIALPDEEAGNRIIAFVSLNGAAKLSNTEILSHIRALLPKYMIPEEVQIRESLPRTSTNKIDRNQLRADSKHKNSSEKF